MPRAKMRQRPKSKCEERLLDFKDIIFQNYIHYYSFAAKPQNKENL